MKEKPCEFLEERRVRQGRMGSDRSYGNNGVFQLETKEGVALNVIASDGMGWEHVSVSLASGRRCPTWEEMCWVKDLFWNAEEVVVEYHPARSEYVNVHPYCLHLWKPVGVDLPTPPSILVGPKKARR